MLSWKGTRNVTTRWLSETRYVGWMTTRPAFSLCYQCVSPG